MTNVREQEWFKAFQQKVKQEMQNVVTELPQKSLLRLLHDDDISFYESVN